MVVTVDQAEREGPVEFRPPLLSAQAQAGGRDHPTAQVPRVPPESPLSNGPGMKYRNRFAGPFREHIVCMEGSIYGTQHRASPV